MSRKKKTAKMHHALDTVRFVMWILAGIAQGVESHRGWRAEAHWVVTTAILVLDEVHRHMLLIEQGQTISIGALALMLVFIVLIARALKHACYEAAVLNERVFRDGRACAYLAFVACITHLVARFDISVHMATIITLFGFVHVVWAESLAVIASEAFAQRRGSEVDRRRPINGQHAEVQ